MASNWHYARDGQRFGPFSSAQLQQLAAAKRLLPTDTVWREGMQGWQPAASIKGLFPAQATEDGAQPGPRRRGSPSPQKPGRSRDPKPSPAAYALPQLRPNEAPEGTRPQPFRRFRFFILGGVCGLVVGLGVGVVATLGVVGYSGGTTGKADAPGSASPQNAGQPEKGTPASKASSLTRDEFRKKVRNFKVYNSPDPNDRWDGRNIDDLSQWGWLFAQDDFDQAFGKPTRTETIGKNRYWYWQCQDGTVQVILGEDWPGRVPLVAINDY